MTGGVGTPRLLASVDGSSYMAAVCDYAAWFAGRIGASISLLHVAQSDSASANAVLTEALSRLADQGVEDVQPVLASGRFAEAVEPLIPLHTMLLMGKRGVGGDQDRAHLGSNVDVIVRRATRPVCLVSHLFLPVTRALVLLDADPEHRRTVQFVCDHPWLSSLELDLVVMTDGVHGAEKLAWAREQLRARDADIFSLTADGPHAALAQYREKHAIDLLILSREIALEGGAARLRRIEEDSVWAWRAPVLIC
jgi:hypothetical protein